MAIRFIFKFLSPTAAISRFGSFITLIVSVLASSAPINEAVADVAESTHLCERIDQSFIHDQGTFSGDSIIENLVQWEKSLPLITVLRRNFVEDGLDTINFNGTTYSRPIPYGYVFLNNDYFGKDLLYVSTIGQQTIILKFDVATYSYLGSDNNRPIGNITATSEMWSCEIQEFRNATPSEIQTMFSQSFESSKLYKTFIDDLAKFRNGCPNLFNGTVNDYNCR